MIVAISAKKRCGKDSAAQFILEQHPDNFKSYALADPIKRALCYGLAVSGVNVVTNGLRDVDRYYTMDDLNGITDVDREEKLVVGNFMAEHVFDAAWQYIVQRKPELRKYNEAVKIEIDKLVNDDSMNNEWSIRRLMQAFGTDIGVNVDKIIWIRFMLDVYIEALRDNIVLIITDCRQPFEMDMLRKISEDTCVIHIVRKGFSDTVTDAHSTEQGLPIMFDDIVISNNGTLEEFKEKILNIFKHSF